MKGNTDKGKLTTGVKRKVWNKAALLQGHPPDIWRRDMQGNVIHWQEYENKESKYGWKIHNANLQSNELTDIEYLHPVHIDTPQP
ncbi:MAG TPA: hypothetical protein VIN07_05720 [Flavipsychrobacter sp.]